MSNAAALSTLVGGDFDPVLIAPDQTNRITSYLRAMADDPIFPKMMAEAANDMAHDDFWPAADSWQSQLKPYVVKAGILHIPVKGALLHNFPYAYGSYATGYYYIQKCLEHGLADPEVKGIALVCDSPGGHVAGCFELCDKIYEARSVKPIRAFAHEHAFSAAYAVFSSASHGTVSRTGGVGSIGVVTMHINFAKAMEMNGVEITFIHAGKHKVDGNPYQALSEGAKARIQTRIDESYGVFCQQVARNRGIDEKKVRKTEALTYTASEAVDESLADKIGPLDEAMAEFCASIMGATGDTKMTTVTQADHDKAVAAAAATAASTAQAAERTRIAGIKACAEAKDRPLAAENVAMNTDMSVEAAAKFLAGMPVETKQEAAAPKQTNSGSTGFEKAMEGAAPGPGATGTEQEKVLTADEKADAAAARILAARFGAEQPSTAKH